MMVTIKYLILQILFGLSPLLLYSQNYEIKREIDSSFFKNIIIILENEFGKNKIFIQKYKLQSLIALSKYPELKNISITFKYHKLKTSLACRPKINFLFKKRTKRKYNIFINKKSKKLEGILLKDVPFNAQVGVIAHEIAHIVDYLNKKNSKVIVTGINYLSIKKREKLEKTIDSIAIYHGFGWQVYDWINFILNKSDVSKEYKDYKRQVYLEPKEIIEIINSYYLIN